MSTSPWLVVPAEGAQPIGSTPQLVHEAVATSRLAPHAPVSIDGGRSWMPAMRALEWHRSQAADLALIVPTRVEPSALIAGYLGLFSLLFFGGPICVVAALMSWDRGPKPIVGVVAILVGAVLGPLPVLWPARKGHRALQADASLNGMLRVWTAYVAAALMTLALLAAVIGLLARLVG